MKSKFSIKLIILIAFIIMIGTFFIAPSIKVNAEDNNDVKVLTSDADGYLYIDDVKIEVIINYFGESHQYIPDGIYKLESDVKSDACYIRVKVEQNVSIDLNGYTWDTGSKYIVLSGVLSLYDTSENKTGKITSSFSSTISLSNEASGFNLYSGTVENTSDSISACALSSTWGSSNLYGGKLKSNAYAVFYYLQQNITINLDDVVLENGEGYAEFSCFCGDDIPQAVIDVTDYKGGKLAVEINMEYTPDKIVFFTGVSSIEEAANYTVQDEIKPEFNNYYPYVFVQKTEYNEETGELSAYLGKSSFTQHPTLKNNYTCEFNNPDTTFLWYEVIETVLVPETVIKESIAVFENGKWKVPAGNSLDIFNFKAQAGDIFKISSNSSEFFDVIISNDDGSIFEVVSILENGFLVISEDIEAKVCVDTYYLSSDLELEFSLIHFIDEVDGQTGKSLQNIACGNSYICKATTSTGYVTYSNVLSSTDTHTGGEKTCMGYKCEKCQRWYGEKDEDAHTIVDDVCVNCNEFMFVMVGQQLNIGGDLSMKYLVETLQPIDIDKLTMQFFFLGELKEVKATPLTNEENTYCFVLEGINPQCMGDSIDAYLYYNGDLKVKKLGYTVEENLNNLLLKYPDNENLVTLINDTLAYGKAASDYRDYPSITENYQGKDREIPENYVDTTGYSTVQKYYVRFGMLSSIIIEIDDLPYEVFLDGKKIYCTDEGPNYFIIPNISATDFDREYTFDFHLYGESLGTFTISLNDCLYEMSQSSTDEFVKALAKAFYNFGTSTMIYAHVVHGVGEHMMTEYINNLDSTHSHVCKYCEYIDNEMVEKHTYDENNNCVCGANVSLVSTADELLAAFEKGGDIKLLDNISRPNDYSYKGISTDVVIDLNGYNITITENGGGLSTTLLTVIEGGTLTIIGEGTVTHEYYGPSSSCTGGELTINCGTYNSNVYFDNGIGTINNGIFNERVDVFGGTLTINGGIFNSYVDVSESNTVTINGGTFNTELNVHSGILTINGGTFNCHSINLGMGTLTITGGTFSFNPTEYLHEGYTAVYNEVDGVWTVV